MMSWNSVSAGSTIVMLTYFAIDDHVDLYPWNNLVSPQLPGARTHKSRLIGAGLTNVRYAR
jgi:hypothetical protein